MDRSDLIRFLGDVITEVDVLRSEFSRGTKKRIELDDLRDQLDMFQRQFVRNVIKDNTQKFADLTESLTDINRNLRKTIDEVDKVADTLETLVQLVGVVQKIAELAR
jgi:hypothetical protein